jgi:hypothetical protein
MIRFKYARYKRLRILTKEVYSRTDMRLDAVLVFAISAGIASLVGQHHTTLCSRNR